ncbi:MAG TPA: anaerobic C4-dicarboxylate transporter family protein, partial [Candidatus Methylomirabilis sp.]|nr:anaerobic C4-dicarboxylate transporter family protein [Candidatus Methylomirabilis sp.]
MTLTLLFEFIVVLAAIVLGSRAGGVGLGFWGGIGVLVLTFGFGLPPTSPPIDVMLIILAVIMAASVMEAAGGIDYLVSVAERIIRRNPRQITVVAPIVSYAFTLGAGTGHVFYPLLPIIHDVAHENGIRPERPIAISTIASQQAITASPVSAAMAAMIALFDPAGFGLTKIMLISIPATLLGVIVGALIQTHVGKELADDPEYNRRLRAGEIEAPSGRQQKSARAELPPSARTSAFLFLLGVVFVVVAGLFPGLRPLVPKADKVVSLDMATTIQIVMLSLAGLMLLVTRTSAASVP